MEQLREMDLGELKEQAESLKESLFRLKFKKSLGVGDSTNDIRREKKTLARVFTLIADRESKEKAEV
jgi:large subunit ribosomal protein L29